MQPNVSLIPNVLIQDLLNGGLSFEEFAIAELLFLNVPNTFADPQTVDRLTSYLANGKMTPGCQVSVTKEPTTTVHTNPVVRKQSRTVVKKPTATIVKPSPEAKAQGFSNETLGEIALRTQELLDAKLTTEQIIQPHQVQQLAGLIDGNLTQLEATIDNMAHYEQQNGVINKPVAFLLKMLQNTSGAEQVRLRDEREKKSKGGIVEGVYATVMGKIQNGEYDHV